MMTLYPARVLISLQAVAAMAALVLLTMWPPVSGDMLLVSITSNDANAVARGALAADAVLVGAGPFRGSLVVNGDRSSIARQTASWDVLILAAPPAGCGAGATRGVLT